MKGWWPMATTWKGPSILYVPTGRAQDMIRTFGWHFPILLEEDEEGSNHDSPHSIALLLCFDEEPRVGKGRVQTNKNSSVHITELRPWEASNLSDLRIFRLFKILRTVRIFRIFKIFMILNLQNNQS